jgi:hypothetical protein
VIASLVVAWWGLVSPARAEEPPPEAPLAFVVGPRMPMEPGVRSVHAFGRLAFVYDDALGDAVQLDEAQTVGRVAGVVGRSARLALVDLPLVLVQTAVVHEVFGHGARARELRLSPTYTFRLVPPYRGWLSGYEDDDALATTYLLRSGVTDEDIAVSAAGVEANQTSAAWLRLDAGQRAGWMHRRDQLRYVTARLDYAGSLLRGGHGGAIDPATSNDIGGYVGGLQRRFDAWRPDDRLRIERTLQLGYGASLLADPVLWASATHLLGGWLMGGQREARLPGWSVGGDHLLPTTRFQLAPYGPEHGLGLLWGRASRVVEVSVRVGTGGLAPSAGVGVQALGLSLVDDVRLGLDARAWWQPDLLFERLYAFDRPQRVGGLLGVELDAPVHDALGLVGRLSLKSEGYALAQPLAAGPSAYLGLMVRPPARAMD